MVDVGLCFFLCVVDDLLVFLSGGVVVMYNFEQKIVCIDMLCWEVCIFLVIIIDCEVDILLMVDVFVVGGLIVLEIILCMMYGLIVIWCFSEECLYLCIGVGIVFDLQIFVVVEKVGVSFVVILGCIDELLCFVLDSEVLLLFGVVSVFEIMFVYCYGYCCFKLFFVEVSGGLVVLKVFLGLFFDICFCFIGGVSLNNFVDYLVVFNVMCVGGIWMLFKVVVDCGDWVQVECFSCEVLECFVEYCRY